MAPTTPNRNATTVVGSPLRRSPRGHQSPSRAAAPSLPARRSPRKLALKWKSVKPGLKKGQRISQGGDRRTRGEWYQICHNFRTLAIPPRSKVAFLKGKGFKGTNSDQTSFAKYLRQYDNGKLLPNETMKRAQSSKFPQLEERLIQYIDLRAENYSKDKCGVSFTALQARALKFAQEMDIPEDEFSASNGWLSRTLHRHNRSSIALHGEAGDMDPEEKKEIITKWKENEFWPLIEQYKVQMRCCIYNGDQTGLFYKKLPNRIYVDKTNKSNYRGAKQMFDKSRITLMVCTAANSEKAPLAMVGKPARPTCFNLCDPPMAYTSQKSAWFDRRVTSWWIDTVFIPFHVRRNGHQHCILILDNFSGHMIDWDTKPDWLHPLFLPPNVTNSHQPADMGMISSLKTGYRMKMLEQLLQIFDEPGGFEAAAEARKQARRG